MANTYILGVKHWLYCGLNASAPADASDETDGVYVAIGESPTGWTLNSNREEIAQRRADAWPNVTVDVGYLTETLSATIFIDQDAQQALTDLRTAHRSATAGVAAAGTHIYFIITDAVSGHVSWYGNATVPQFNYSTPNSDYIQAQITLSVSGGLTEANHS